MAIAYKGALVIAALSVLSLTTACTGEEKAPAAKAPAAEAPAQNADDAVAKKKADAEKPGASRSGVEIPQQQFAEFTALAGCLRKAGVNVPQPEPGQLWDTSAMDSIVMTPPWDKAMADCPDWERLVIKVG